MADSWKPDGQGGKFPLEWWLQNKCWAKDRQGFVRIRDYSYDDQLQNIHYKIEYCECNSRPTCAWSAANPQQAPLATFLIT